MRLRHRQEHARLPAAHMRSPRSRENDSFSVEYAVQTNAWLGSARMEALAVNACKGSSCPSGTSSCWGGLVVSPSLENHERPLSRAISRAMLGHPDH